MTTTVQYKEDIEKLIAKGKNLHAKLIFETTPSYASKFEKANPKRYKDINEDIKQFSSSYQQWYSEAYELIRQLLPSRLKDFEEYYKGKGIRKDKEITYASYTIKDALNGLQVTKGYNQEKVVGADAAINLVDQQLRIVEAVKGKFESSLYDIKTLVHAELLDNEIDEAKVLAKNGYLRAAGAIAGVALEAHLKTVAEQHSISVPRNSTLSALNDALKDIVINPSEWRKIQYLSDIRNKCDHKKQSEPTLEDINDLIAGVERVVKNTF